VPKFRHFQRAKYGLLLLLLLLVTMVPTAGHRREILDLTLILMWVTTG
jgi:hypothetical protein